MPLLLSKENLKGELSLCNFFGLYLSANLDVNMDVCSTPITF